MGIHHIDTGDTQPGKQCMRRFSMWVREEIEKIQQMLEMEVICECESAWAAICVVIFKKRPHRRTVLINSTLILPLEKIVTPCVRYSRFWIVCMGPQSKF